MTRLEFVVETDEAGSRLDVVLAARTGLSRSTASTLEALVDGKRAAKSLRLEEGQRVGVDLPEEAPVSPAATIEVRIAYEDEHLMIVDKPAGLVVHPSPGHEGGTLVNALLARAEKPAGGEAFRPGIVHRLDAGTSGLMLVAKSEEAFDALSAMIASRLVRREYRALVEGTPPAHTATIDAPIGRSSRHRKKMAVVAEGREAITHYETLERLGETTLLAVTLETGRTHQIRVHLAEIGHPVVGDPAYGRSKKIAVRLGLARPFLHATRLSLTHPITGTALDVSSPLPPDLQAALASAASGAAP